MSLSRGVRRRGPALVAATLALLLLSSCAVGGGRGSGPQQELQAELQHILDRWRERDGVTAAAMAVDLPGEIAWEGASGWSDRRGGRRVTSGDHFRIASVTKTFVATVVLQLADERRISLDDEILAYVPDAPYGTGVRISHLLNHTSGIPEAQDSRWAREALQHPNRPWSRERLLAAAAKKSRRFEPGSQFQYSNTNYLLLGDLISAVTGSGWGQQVRDRIIQPLGLSNTFVSVDEMASERVVGGYVDTDRDGVTDDLFKGPWKPFEDPAGGMISTAPDLIRFGRGLFEGKLLNHESLERMISARYFTPSTGYGLGVQFSKPDLVTTVVGHTGSMPGFTAALMYLPEQRLAIAALANDGSSSAFDLGELAIRAVMDRLSNLQPNGTGQQVSVASTLLLLNVLDSGLQKEQKKGATKLQRAR